MYTRAFAGFITRTSNYLRMPDVDNTQNIISFCTGYSGLELGIKRAGVDVRTICYLEIEVYVQAVLVKAIQEGRLCPAPIWTNVKSFDARPFRGVVDGITGGFPCQPFSSAGKRKGQEDPRHLWPSIANAIRLCRPGWVFLENVPGLVTLGLRDVLQDLGQMGYRTTWGIFSAEEVGAPHQRKRVFILGYSTSKRPHRGSKNCEGEQSEVLGERLESDEELAHPNCDEQTKERGDNGEVLEVSQVEGQELSPTLFGGESTQSDELANPTSRQPRQSQARNGGQDTSRGSEDTQWPARPGEEQYEWEEPRVVGNTASGGSSLDKLQEQSGQQSEVSRARHDKAGTVTEAKPQLGGATHGTQHRVDRLRLLGNGVVPQTAELAWKTLWKEINKYE